MLLKALTCLMMTCQTQINTFFPFSESIPPQPQSDDGSEIQGPIDGIKALGFQYDSGAAWSVLCKETEHGTIPGKRDHQGGVYYPWGGQEHVCNSYDIISGKLIHHLVPLVPGCEPKGFQTNDNSKYYNAVVNGAHGMVPGKANTDLTMAWYSWGGQEHFVKDDFYVVC